MFRQLNRANVLRGRYPEDQCRALAGHERWLNSSREKFSTSVLASIPPARPTTTLLSEVIPLFYIGQNDNGFWVVRDDQSRLGGLFLFKRSALRFAKNRSAGCATMVIPEPLELDVENQGNQFITLLGLAINLVARRMPIVVVYVSMAKTQWRNLVASVSHALIGERRNREAIEKELFGGQYTLTSKSDDDLLPNP
jgi:hypothetical protein